MYGEQNPQLLATASHALTGGDETHSPKLVITKVQQGNNNIFFNPIPNDLLFQNKTDPQVQVYVNNVLGTCVRHNCQYVINADATPELSTADLDSVVSATSKMTITLNPKTATVTEDLVHITLNGVTCPITTFTPGATITIICTPPKNEDNTKYLLPAGSAKPKVHIDNIGYAIDAAISEITIPLVIDEVDPSTIPSFGGCPIKIKGSGFPLTLKDAEQGLVITLSGTQCIVLSSLPTEITFTSPKENSGSTLSLAFNSQTAESTITFDPTPGPQVTNTSPASASPVQKTDLTITGTGFKLGSEDDTWYQCQLIGRDSAHTSYVLDVLPGSVTSTSITCILSGGVQSTYDIFVRKIKKDATSPFLGFLSNSTALIVKYQLDVTLISPSSGSKAGGTLLTISGSNFATQKNQNLVRIGIDYYPCDIESASESSVTCRTTALPDDDNGGPMEVHYYQRVSESGTCTAVSCEFTYTAAATPIITTDLSAPISFGQGDIITFDGSLLTPTAGQFTKLVINNQEIVATANTDTFLTFTMPGMAEGTYPAKVLVDNLGYASIQTGKLELKAKLEIISISPTSISEGGTLLIIAGNGFNKDTRVKIGSIGECQIKEYTFTTIKCATLPMTGANHIVQIYQIQTSTVLLTCPLCKVSALPANTAIITANNATTATSSNSLSVKFDGTNLDLTAQSDISCEFVSTVPPYSSYPGTIDTSTSIAIEATFANLPAGEYKAFIQFKDKGFAKFNPAAQQITTIETGALTVAPVTSSYTGGQTLTISGDGFASSNGISVKVCGFDCPIESSSYSGVSCKLPEIITVESNELFKQRAPSDIKPASVTGDNVAKAGLVADGLLSTSYSSNAEDCFVTLDFGEKLQAHVHQIIFSPKPTIGLIVFDQSKFLGCNEDCGVAANWETIHSVNQLYLTYGLNTWKPEDSAPKKAYRYVKFTSPNKMIDKEDLQSGCQLTEFYVYGVIVAESAPGDLSCDVDIDINGKKITQSGVVTYSGTATPKIEKLEPPFGSTLGGEEIIITGGGFGTEIAAVSVLLEGEICSVTAVTATQITCTSSPRSANWQNVGFKYNTLRVAIDGQIAANQENNWMYVDRWSKKTTWGGESPPMKGQSAYIPVGRNVIVDESLPELYSIIIEGSFICASFPDYIPAVMTIDAWFIIANRGMIQIGTGKKPYEKKLIITLHGTISDSQLPLFGNKVIAVHEGIFDMHGKVRQPTWTSLSETAEQNTDTIKVENIGDWEIGDQIVISTNDFDYNHTEVRFITAVAGSEITLNETLNYTHFSAVETYGGTEFPMKCEVGLLTRTVKIQGADKSWEDRYGGLLQALYQLIRPYNGAWGTVQGVYRTNQLCRVLQVWIIENPGPISNTFPFRGKERPELCGWQCSPSFVGEGYYHSWNALSKSDKHSWILYTWPRNLHRRWDRNTQFSVKQLDYQYKISLDADLN